MARKVTYDQSKVTKLRMSIIEDSLAVFTDDPKVETWSKYRKELLMKYAPRVLPTLNAGKDDDSDLFPQPLLGGKSNGTNNNRHKKTPTALKED